MLQNITYQNKINTASIATTVDTPSQESLSHVMLINGVGSIDQSIKGLAQEMKSDLNQKNTYRSQVASINTVLNRPKIKLEDGTAAHEVSDAEMAWLNKLADTQLTFTTIGGKHYISEESLTNLKDSINGSIQDLNTGAEMRSLELQSLMDQRKNLMTLLSNMMASGTEIISNIIRNIK